MKEIITYERLIRNLVLSLVFGIILPLIIFSLIDPFNLFFDKSFILGNGIIFTIVYSLFGLFKKHTSIRFFIGIAYIFVLIYLYIVGFNPFTFYLPNCAFATFCVDLNVFNINLIFRFNYAWIVIIILVLIFINLVRNRIKIIESEESTLRIKKD